MTRRGLRFALLVGVLAALAASGQAYAAVRHAAPGADGVEPCLDTDPCSLVDAIDGAATGDEVVVQPGTYLPGQQLLVDTAISVRGTEGQARPVIVGPSDEFTLLIQAFGAELRHLQLETSGNPGVLVVEGSAALSDLIVFGGDGQYANALWLVSSATLQTSVRDSVFHTSGADAASIVVEGRGGSTSSGTSRSTPAVPTRQACLSTGRRLRASAAPL